MFYRFKSYPEGDNVNPEAYKAAIDALKPGDAVIIFTPDSELNNYWVTVTALKSASR